jgi:hypothetical protein
MLRALAYCALMTPNQRPTGDNPVTKVLRRTPAAMLLAVFAVLLSAIAVPTLPYASAQQRAVAEVEEQEDSVNNGELKTLAIVAVAPFDSLISDITFLGTTAGKPELAQMVEGGIAFFTQGKGLEAIDRTRPWGVVVQTDGAQLLPIGCLPVKKLSDLLDVAAAYGVEVKDADDDVKELARPNQPSVFVKEDNGWAFIARSAETLAQLPEDPQVILDEIVSDYDLGIHLAVKQVPEPWRQVAVQWMQLGMQQGLQAQTGGDEESQQARQAMAEAQLTQMKRFMEETDSLTLGWTIDTDQERTYLDMSMVAVPGSKMAQDIAAYEEANTNFAGFYRPESAASMVFATQMDPERMREQLTQLDAMYRSMLSQFDTMIDEQEEIPADLRDDFKAVARDWYGAFIATMETGRMDGAGTLELSPQSLTVVAGAFVKDTAKFESGLKKLDAAAREMHNNSGLKWDAQSHAGVSFHTMTIPVPADQEGPRKLLGEEVNIAFGIGEEAVYFAAGRDWLSAAKQAIEASAKQREKKVPPVEFVISLTPIVETLAAQAEDGPQKDAAEKVAEMLRNEAQDRDHVRIFAEVIPNGIRYRYEAESGVLKAIGKVAEEKQRQAQQANQ